MVLIIKLSRCGGIGRRKGLKIPRGQLRTGSSPVIGSYNKGRFSTVSKTFPYYFSRALSKVGKALFFCLAGLGNTEKQWLW